MCVCVYKETFVHTHTRLFAVDETALVVILHWNQLSTRLPLESLCLQGTRISDGWAASGANANANVQGKPVLSSAGSIISSRTPPWQNFNYIPSIKLAHFSLVFAFLKRVNCQVESPLLHRRLEEPSVITEQALEQLINHQYRLASEQHEEAGVWYLTNPWFHSRLCLRTGCRKTCFNDTLWETIVGLVCTGCLLMF